MAVTATKAIRLTMGGRRVSRPAPWGADPFVPADFKVPVTHKGRTYNLVPLGPALVNVDYDALPSSEHLQKTFSDGKWPHAGITMAGAMKDMQEEEERFQSRKSFAYGVLTLDGKHELGAFYLRPSNKQGFDAAASFWVAKARFDQGFEAVLLKDMNPGYPAPGPSKKWRGHAATSRKPIEGVKKSRTTAKTVRMKSNKLHPLTWSTKIRIRHRVLSTRTGRSFRIGQNPCCTTATTLFSCTITAGATFSRCSLL